MISRPLVLAAGARRDLEGLLADDLGRRRMPEIVLAIQTLASFPYLGPAARDPALS